MILDLVRLDALDNDHCKIYSNANIYIYIYIAPIHTAV